MFVDYDGTITDADTFDVLVRHYAGPAAWDAIEAQLESGSMSLRDVLQAEASLVRASLPEALAILERRVRFDPSFARFVAGCRERGIAVSVVSSGIEPVIRHELKKHGLADLTVIANGLDVSPTGWHIRFRDELANGTDKAAIVRAARDAGHFTVYIGDGRSDFDAALIADRVFAKAGRRLVEFLTERGVPFTAFSHFSEIDVGALEPARS